MGVAQRRNERSNRVRRLNMSRSLRKLSAGEGFAVIGYELQDGLARSLHQPTVVTCGSGAFLLLKLCRRSWSPLHSAGVGHQKLLVEHEITVDAGVTKRVERSSYAVARRTRRKSLVEAPALSRRSIAGPASPNGPLGSRLHERIALSRLRFTLMTSFQRWRSSSSLVPIVVVYSGQSLAIASAGTSMN
jgi:hypothetical protein